LYITAKYLADIVIPQVCLQFTTFVS
jgi:hypothetical protein